MTPQLSSEQEEIVSRGGSVYVRACPGAGKTRTLVARAIRYASALPPAQGVALLSFTNAAADEFKERLVRAGALRLLVAPHFVGTIDSFLGRFVVTPRGNPFAPSRPIQHVDNWSRYVVKVAIGRTRRGKPDMRELPLSAFPVTGVNLISGTVSLRLDLDRLGREMGRGSAEELRARGQAVIAHAEKVAARTLATVLARGLVTPAEVRLLAAKQLLAKDAASLAHAQNLVARFPVLVVDEAQDCDGMVLDLLQRLLETGAEITVIADPDQCIYAWRGADPKGLSDLAKPWGEPATLTGNYRSSPNICRAAASLKEVATVDKSKGDSGKCTWPIFVAPLKYSEPSLMGKLFLELLAEHRIASSNAIVLAPSWSLAMAMAGAERPQDNKQQLGGKLRSACFAARERADVETLKGVRGLVEAYLAKRVDGAVFPSGERSTDAWIDAEVRRLTCEVLLVDPRADSWHERTIATLETFRIPPGLSPGEASARRCLPRPGGALEAPPRPAGGLAFSTVHQAKGREFAAVLFAAARRADDQLKEFMDDWSSRRAGSERRAVGYVGVTRAERLLLFATPSKYIAETQELLRRDGASVELRGA